MDAAVLLIFATFFTTLVVTTTTGHGLLRASVRRPRLFRAALLGAAVVTVPADLYTVLAGTLGPDGAPLGQVADRLLLLNVAFASGIAALHESMRGNPVTVVPVSVVPAGFGGSAQPTGQLTGQLNGRLTGAMSTETVARAVAEVPATTSGTTLTATAPVRPASRPVSADWPDHTEPAVRMGVLGWVGPVMALAAVTAVVAVGSLGNGPELGNVGPVWACYSLLICVISATALLGGRVREAIDPREG